jgi:hypothetical protein
MEVWWIGANGSVQAAFWYEGAQWQRYELAPAGSASINAGITAVSRIPASMEVWWTGVNGSVRDAFWYPDVVNPAITLRAIQDGGRFVEVAGTGFTRNDSVKLGYDIIGFSQDGPTPHQIGEVMLTSDSIGEFSHPIQVQGDISGAQAQATDIASGATATGSL